jgi:glycosyltransferase involved in cell wall biosynthesis
VGVASPGYGAEKVSYGLPTRRYQYRRLRSLPLRRLDRRGTFWSETPVVLDASLALLHTFNQIPVSRHPFVVSFENELPRYLGRPSPWMRQLGLRLLRSRRCQRLLALSEVAARVARERFRSRGAPEVAAKVDVFRGGIAPPAETAARPEERARGSLRLLFVGADAFRKGIVPVVRAVEGCRRGGLEVELTVISAVRGGAGYTHREYTPSAREWRRKLEELPFVEYHAGLPNQRVREEMRRHDALVFPTFDESLGWVIVEAGLERLPTIATNIFAIPELIDDRRSGALVELELGTESRWQGIWETGERRRESIERADGIIEEGITRVLEELVREPSLISQWGEAARRKMMELYHPTRAAGELERIYDAARDGS